MNSPLRDSMSSCPSILDILKHLDRKDVVSCQLLNRRLHHLIKRNVHRLPRPSATVTIEDHGGLIILSDVYEKKSTIRINQQGQVKLTSQHRMLTKGMLRLPEKADQSSPYQKVATYQLFEFNQDAAIKRALSVIFRNFFIGLDIVVDSFFTGWAEKWYPVISKVFQQSGSRRCAFLKVVEERPGLRDLANALGCDILKVNACKLLGDLLPSISVWDRQLELECLLNRNNTLEPLADLIKKWQAGDCSIRNTEIKFKTWSTTSLTVSTFLNFHYSVNSGVPAAFLKSGERMTTSLARSFDNCRLLVSFSPSGNNLRLCESTK